MTITDSSTEDFIAWAASLDDREFRKLVNEYIRTNDPGFETRMESPALLPRVARTLARFQINASLQLDPPARFLRGLNARLGRVEELLGTSEDTEARLHIAVLQHQAHRIADGDWDEIDADLWTAVLGGAR